jgi:peptidoglycan hydrolase CwlO-like protein
MSLTSQLQQAQPRHSALISELASLDHSPSAVSTCDHSISSLTKELGQVQQRLDELERATNETSKEMQELKDSTGRRLLYKLGGKGKTEKFEGRKEEKEKSVCLGLR